MTKSGLETDITKPKKYPLKGLMASPGVTLMYLHVYKLVSFDRLKVFAAMAVKQS